MSPSPASPDLQPAADAAALPLPAAAEARIEHLFRGERRRGLIHPLQHLIQRYRAEGGIAAASPEAAP